MKLRQRKSSLKVRRKHGFRAKPYSHKPKKAGRKRAKPQGRGR